MSSAESHQPGNSLFEKRLFSTGEAAVLCGLSQQTIIRCFDSGRLTGFKVPGSRFRRIPRDELLRFMRANSIDTSPLDPGRTRVLVIEKPGHAPVAEGLRSLDRLEVFSASGALDAGFILASIRPHAVVVDSAHPDVRPEALMNCLRRLDAGMFTPVVFLGGEDRSLRALGAAGSLAESSAPAAIAQTVEQALNSTRRR